MKRLGWSCDQMNLGAANRLKGVPIHRGDLFVGTVKQVNLFVHEHTCYPYMEPISHNSVHAIHCAEKNGCAAQDSLSGAGEVNGSHVGQIEVGTVSVDAFTVPPQKKSHIGSSHIERLNFSQNTQIVGGDSMVIVVEDRAIETKSHIVIQNNLCSGLGMLEVIVALLLSAKNREAGIKFTQERVAVKKAARQNEYLLGMPKKR